MIEVVPYAGRPTNYRVTDGRLEAIVTADVGPRVLRLGLVGGPNEFAELPEVSQPTPYGDWRLYGGHRLWHSPEAMPRSYYPDNDPCTVEVDDDYVSVAQAVEPPTGIQKTMRLRPGEGFIEVDHVLTNEGLWPIEAAPWALSVMAPGGTALLQPASQRDPQNLLPNRSLILWPYTDLTDDRLVLGRDLILLHQRADAAGPIKVGVNNDGGWAAYYNQGRLFIKRFAVDIFAVYPDNGCTVECYTNAQMLELESLGSLVLLEPGESAYHTERWYLFEVPHLPLDDEEALLEAVNGHLSRTSEPG
ncbi:MAG: hypothetical protein HPY83_01955 [Anaerolineae bacterium]|nr:hypothetical protein [Anaerolineae bacterium]